MMELAHIPHGNSSDPTDRFAFVLCCYRLWIPFFNHLAFLSTVTLEPKIYFLFVILSPISFLTSGLLMLAIAGTAKLRKISIFHFVFWQVQNKTKQNKKTF